MNQVATRSATAVAALQSLKKGIANVKQTLVKKGGDPFLKILKSGKWVYGQEDTEVEPGSAWAINPLSIMHGWVAWKRGEGADNSSGPVNEIMVSASAPKPAEHELPDISNSPDARWGQQFSFSMVCLTGEDKGEQVLYKTNSVGGIAVVDQILNAISAQLDDDPENPVPVVVLDSDTYRHKKHGQVVTPIMDIKTWRPLSDDLPDVQAELDEQEDGKPAAEPEKVKRTRKASVPATGNKAADEDDELARMEAEIARRKAEKEAAKQPAETDAQRRKRELQAQIDALDAGDGNGEDVQVEAEASTPAAQPMRRRRNA